LDAERYLRQILLAEIGEAGQRAIAAATVQLGGPPGARDVARLYAERAGFRRIEETAGELGASADDAAVLTPAAREVLAGSRAVARAMVAATAGVKRS
jgi:hypothetical protein